ncbi:hypothetical protein DESC_370232 [Desulfosarcina cetonica]|nr:hypothetical protein DESC_370232 [Desulfosarcina cetonica]
MTVVHHDCGYGRGDGDDRGRGRGYAHDRDRVHDRGDVSSIDSSIGGFQRRGVAWMKDS